MSLQSCYLGFYRIELTITVRLLIGLPPGELQIIRMQAGTVEGGR